MHVLSLSLNGFKPLSNNGIGTIELDFPSPLTIFIGDNGSGKTSVMRQLNPRPPVSTSYFTGGSKLCTLEHKGANYSLFSDFTKTNGNHSFKKDGIELNESGNSTAQRELCESELGYTDHIHTLTCNRFRLCDMTPSQRKSIFFELYPGDLSFLLDEHKHVCSKIRDYRSSLSTLDEMRMDIKNQMIDDDEKLRQRQTKDKLEQRNNTLDRSCIMLEEELKSIRTSENYNYVSDMINSLEDADEELERIFGTVVSDYLQHRDDFDARGFDVKIAIANSVESAKQEQINKLTNDATRLTKELSEYRASTENNVEDEIKRIRSKYETAKEKSNTAIVNANIPTLTKTEYDRCIEDVQPTLFKYIESLCELCPHPMSPKEISEHENKIDESRHNLRQLEIEREELEKSMIGISSELTNLEDRDPPTDCIRSCKLKSGHEKIRKSLKIRTSQIKHRLTDIEKLMKTLERDISDIEEKCSGPNQVVHMVEEIINTIQWEPWGKYVLDGRDPMDVIRDNPTQILSRLRLVIANTETKFTKDTALHEMQESEKRLEIIIQAKASAGKLLSEIAASKEADMESLLIQLSRLERDANRVKNDVIRLSKYSNLLDRAKRLEIEVRRYGEARILASMEEYDILLQQEITNEKNNNTELLRRIDTVLSKQNDLETRLSESVLPIITNIRKQLNIAISVAPMLSLHGGFPAKYMSTFLNNVILSINFILSSVWGYDLELLPLDNPKSIDFKFPVMINETTKLSDCGECSAGEKEILDLATQLALCRLLHLTREYPILLDEPDSALSTGHRTKLANLISELVSEKEVAQLMVVNHHHTLFSAFQDTSVVCLKSDNIILPERYNENVKIT